MCTGGHEIRFSHSMCDAVRERNSHRGRVSSSVDTSAQGPASSRFSHALNPIGERNELADLDAWHRQQGREAAGRRALAKAVGGGGR